MLKLIALLPLFLGSFAGPLPISSVLTYSASIDSALIDSALIEAAAFETSPFRWGRDGHKIVCEIAYLEVSSTTRKAIDDILTEDDDYDSFPESCLWADVIRREAKYDKYPTAHYMNIPRGASVVSADLHCETTYCVIEAIEDMSGVLESTRFSSSERLEALKFLTHFIGDLHQPLHAGYGDDRGGNGTEVTIWGEKRNLHSVWDWTLIEKTGVSWQAYATRLEGEITPVDRQLWAQGSATDWANESYRIVEDAVYDVGDTATIGDEYYERNIATIEQQLKKSAIRMAMVLDWVLGE
jgi:hypothetical protein